MKPVPLLTALAPLLVGCAGVAQAQETPELAGLRYFDAERTVNWAALAHVMHPVGLRQIRESLLPILESPAADTIVRRLFGTTDLRAVSDSTVFERLMEFRAAESPDVYEAIRGAQAEMIGHVAEGRGDTAHVVYRLTMPVQGVSYTMLNVLSVARWSGGWRVLPQAELSWAATFIQRLVQEQGTSSPREAAAPLAAGLALYRQDRIQEAADSLALAVQLAPTNTDALLYLAEARRKLFQFGESAALARRVLERSSCSSFAHTVLAMDYSPLYSNLVQASNDSAWLHLMAAVRCDSSDGNAWMGLQEEAMRVGDTAVERHARRRLVETGYLSPAALAHGRWVLNSLPPRALLLTDGNLETHATLALQTVERLRTDVAVVNLWLLHVPWYARLVRERFGVPLYLDDAGLDAAWEKGLFNLADSLVYLWRLAEQRGTLGRPVAFGPMVGSDSMVKHGPGRFRWAGAYFAAAPTGDTLLVDTARVRVALSAARPRDLGGAAAGARDHVASRISLPDGRFAQPVAQLWAVYISVLADAGRVAEARQSFVDLTAFVQKAGLRDSYSIRTLENIRVRLALEH